eukprot:TRINITY_DN2386_c0_g1_i3.p1 TRINITY_DN2386_c0_g1~~TRINITY_DN2386_c0_g1_i3.p1  ORF type:complete len:368 (-),score=58.03 TRINITY_DN2386_c0_g1_i3:260-1363(-)
MADPQGADSQPRVRVWLEDAESSEALPIVMGTDGNKYTLGREGQRYHVRCKWDDAVVAEAKSFAATMGYVDVKVVLGLRLCVDGKHKLVLPPPRTGQRLENGTGWRIRWVTVGDECMAMAFSRTTRLCKEDAPVEGGGGKDTGILTMQLGCHVGGEALSRGKRSTSAEDEHECSEDSDEDTHLQMNYTEGQKFYARPEIGTALSPYVPTRPSTAVNPTATTSAASRPTPQKEVSESLEGAQWIPVPSLRVTLLYDTAENLQLRGVLSLSVPAHAPYCSATLVRRSVPSPAPLAPRGGPIEVADDEDPPKVRPKRERRAPIEVADDEEPPAVGVKRDREGPGGGAVKRERRRLSSVRWTCDLTGDESD